MRRLQIFRAMRGVRSVAGAWATGFMAILVCHACAIPPRDYILYSGAGRDEALGPWSRFPGVLLSRKELTQHPVPGLLRIEVLKVMADELLRLEGATSCDVTDPVKRKPIPNISVEYCSALYVVNTADDEQTPSYELRLTTPRRNLVNPERGCVPPQSVRDADFPAHRTTLIGLLHNHPCWRGPSTPDMGTWPVDFDFTQGMSRLDLYPGNGVTGEPPVIEGAPIVVQSFIFARKGDQPIYLLLRSTGDVHEWNGGEWEWRARCEPDPSGGGPAKCVPLFTPGGG